jgi:hypothetical protein
MSTPEGAAVRAAPSSALPYGVVVAVAAASVASLIAGMIASPPDALFVAGWIPYPVVGAAILRQLPGQGVGTAMLGIGAGWGLGAAGLWLLTLVPAEARGWVALVTEPGFGIAVAAGILMLALFPQGWPETRRQRWLVGSAVLLALVQAVGVALDAVGTADAPASPLGIAQLGVWPGRVADWALLAGQCVLLAALADLVVRSRRSVGERRLQFRWFMFSAGAALGIITLSIVTPVWGAILVVALAAPPVGIGIAVTRHGLYGIDRLISRSITYLVVSGSVVLMYGLVVASVTRLVPTSSTVAVAAATLAAAAVFRPILRGVQDRVDRRFDRARYDALHTAERLAAVLRDEVDPRAASAALIAAIDRTLQPSSVLVWTRGDR